MNIVGDLGISSYDIYINDEGFAQLLAKRKDQQASDTWTKITKEIVPALFGPRYPINPKPKPEPKRRSREHIPQPYHNIIRQQREAIIQRNETIVQQKYLIDQQKRYIDHLQSNINRPSVTQEQS